MARRLGMLLVVTVPLAFAAASIASPIPPFSIASGPITSLAQAELTVQAKSETPTSCARTSSSPTVSSFQIGDLVTIYCKHGLLTNITVEPGEGRDADIPIPGFPGVNRSALETSGPHPTNEQCVAAWNATAPAAARLAIGAMSPLAAQITTGYWGNSSPPPEVPLLATGPSCSIWFVLAPSPRAQELGLSNQATAWVISPWRNGTALHWSGVVERGSVFLPLSQAWFWVSKRGVLSSAV